MPWNYRAIKETKTIHLQGSDIEDTVYRVYEVYYDKEGNIDGWTAKPTYPQGETLDELRSGLRMMLRDIDRNPILDMEELRKQFPKDEE